MVNKLGIGDENMTSSPSIILDSSRNQSAQLGVGFPLSRLSFLLSLDSFPMAVHIVFSFLNIGFLVYNLSAYSLSHNAKSDTKPDTK